MPGVEVISDHDYSWLRWPTKQEALVRKLLPVAGVTLFVMRDHRWYQLGRRMPADPVPLDRPGVPLIQLLIPAPFEPEMQTCLQSGRLSLTLAPDRMPRQTSAMRCSLAVMEKWIDQATSAQFSGMRGAVADDQAFVLGANLPLLPGNQRYWGTTILAPLGFRPDPPFSDRVLSQALQIQRGEIAFLEETGVEVLPPETFSDITRAGIRLALRNRP